MTSVRITHGACGNATVVEVESRGKKEPLSVTIRSECETVAAMARDIRELDRMDAFVRYRDNPVYRAADRHLQHVSCPVPAGILMALEVEAGLNVPSLTRIEFTDGADGSLEG